MRYLAISVDTEADRFGKEKNRTTSIEEGIDFLQKACSASSMKPTYLVTYEIAAREEGVRAIKKYLDRDECEVGHHMHIWSTPPFENVNSYGVEERWINGLQSEIPDDIFEKKMRCLHETIEKNYGVRPTSHRAGRWAIDKRTLLWLERENYLVDTSICPYISWTSVKGINDYVKTDGRLAPNEPYYPDPRNIATAAIKKEDAINVLEVPVTGVRGDLLSRVKIKGMGRFILFLNKLGYGGINNSMFRPSCNLSTKYFHKLTHRVFQSGANFMNFMMHSNELVLGASPHSIKEEYLKRIRDQISFVLKTAEEYGIKGITLSEAAGYFRDKREE